MAKRGVQRVAGVVEAVVRVDLVAVLHPDPVARREDEVGRQAQLRAGGVVDRGRRLEVPGQVAVVVADGVDDLAAALDDPGQGLAQVGVGVEDVARGGARVGEHLHDVPGEHHGEVSLLRVRGEPGGQHLSAAPGDGGPLGRQVQVADREHCATRGDGNVEQVGDIGSWRSHDYVSSPRRSPSCVSRGLKIECSVAHKA